MKRYLVLIMALMLLILPQSAFARGGGSHSSFHSSFSSSRSYSRPTVNLSKSSTTRTYTSRTSSNHYTVKRPTTYHTTRYTTVHHYHYYEPSPFHYYDGFTTGMIMSSFFHPWGGVYVVNGQPMQYGSSVDAWVADIFLLIVIGFIAFVIISMILDSISFRRRFRRGRF